MKQKWEEWIKIDNNEKRTKISTIMPCIHNDIKGTQDAKGGT